MALLGNCCTTMCLWNGDLVGISGEFVEVVEGIEACGKT